MPGVMERDKSLSGERKYSNDDITVFWKPEACIHASYCYRELIEVFDPGRRPWVDMKGASSDKIIETVNLCPTDALSWKWNDESKNENTGPDQSNHIKFRRPELVNTVTSLPGEKPVIAKVMVDGPIVLSGNFTIINEGVTKEVRDGIMSFCRCGESSHQPYCDGMHRKRGFIG
jgi:uncharacterized Fe-S cluster protein YjdI